MICDELAKHDTFRNFMAHGLLAITSDSKNNHLFEFRLYQRQAKGKFNITAVQTTIPRIKVAVDKVQLLVRQAIQLFEKIYIEKNLEKSQPHGVPRALFDPD